MLTHETPFRHVIIKAQESRQDFQIYRCPPSACTVTKVSSEHTESTPSDLRQVQPSISRCLLHQFFEVELLRPQVECLDVVVRVWRVEPNQQPHQPGDFLRMRSKRWGWIRGSPLDEEFSEAVHVRLFATRLELKTRTLVHEHIHRPCC